MHEPSKPAALGNVDLIELHDTDGIRDLVCFPSARSEPASNASLPEGLTRPKPSGEGPLTLR